MPSSTSAANDSGSHRSIKRALAILELCATEPLSAPEIAERLDVHRTTVTRIIAALAESGMIQHRSDGRYAPGLRLVALGQSALDNYDSHTLLHPYLQQLSDDSGLTVQFAMLTGDDITYVDKIQPPASIRLDTRIGASVVEQTAGVAKAILAWMPAAKLEQRLASWQWKQFTPNTLMTPAAYQERLAEARRQGWTYDEGEYDELSHNIAAPVRNYTGSVVGAVSLTAIATKVSTPQLRAFIPQLLATTDAMSRQLGWESLDS